MELYTLEVSVRGQKLELLHDIDIFSGDQNVDHVHFTFQENSEWFEMNTIFAVFSRYGGTSYKVPISVETGYAANIPAEVMQKKGYIYIGLFGEQGDNILTSSVLQFQLGEGAVSKDTLTPTNDIYEQFIEDLNAYRQAVSDLEGIQADIEQAQSDVSDLSDTLTELGTTMNGIEGRLTTAEGKLGTAEGKITTIEGKVQTIEGKISTAEGKISTIEGKLTTAEGKITAIEGDVTTLQGDVGTLQDTVTALGNTLDTLTDDIETAQSDIGDLQSDIASLQATLDQYGFVSDAIVDGQSLKDSNNIVDLSFAVIQDEASGDIATFTDGSGTPMTKCLVNLEPKQDLHGHDKPWAGGGGANKIKFSTQTVSRTVNGLTSIYNPDTDIIKVTGTNTSSSAYGCLSSSVPPSGNLIIPDFTAGETWTLSVSTVSGSLAHTYMQINYTNTNGQGKQLFLANASTDRISTVTIPNDFGSVSQIFVGILGTATTVNFECRIQLELGSTATSYSPYSNICPISGHDSVGVSVTGKNLFGGVIFADAIQNISYSPHYSRDDVAKTFTFSHSVQDQQGSYDRPFFKPIGDNMEQLTCIITYKNTGGNNNCLVFRYTDNTVGSISLVNSNGQKTTVAVSSINGKQVQSVSLNYYADAITTVYYDECGIFEGVLAVDDYEPYIRIDYTTTLVTNVWDEEWEVGDIDSSTGENVTGYGLIRSVNYIPVLPNTSYYFYLGAAISVNMRTRFYDADKNYIGYSPSSGSSVLPNSVFVTPVNCAYMRFATPSGYGSTYNNDIAIYYPPMPDGKVYGGTVDLVSGTLTVDRELLTFDGSSDEIWNPWTPSGAYYIHMGALNRQRYNMVSNQFDFKGLKSSYPDMQAGEFVANSTNLVTWNGNISFKYDSGQDLEGFKDYIATNPIQVVLELETPQTYQLTPQQVRSLLGTNNVWSEDGTVEVKYIVNLKDYIDKRLPSVQTLSMSRPNVSLNLEEPTLAKSTELSDTDLNVNETIETGDISDGSTDI